MGRMTEIDGRYLPSLSKVFSPIVMERLIQYGKSDFLNEIIEHSAAFKGFDRSLPLFRFFEEIYNYLNQNYRNEYIYKNVLAKQCYRGEHSQNSHMLTELRVSNCKADVVILNGTSTAYEIKSELDSFDRLEKQIRAYSSMFDHIYVITSVSQASKLCDRLPSHVGIQALKPNNEIDLIRHVRSNKKDISNAVIFDSFRKLEYIQIIKSRFGTVPDVPNTQIHQECKDLFCTLSQEEAHETMLQTLSRRSNTLLRDVLAGLPVSLRAWAVSAKIDESKHQRLMLLLKQRTDSVLS